MHRSRLNRNRYFAFVACFGYLLCSAWAHAGSLQVSPLRLTLSSAQTIDAITVHNSGSDSMVVQVQAFTWSQEDEQDIYIPTKEILANPPIFSLPAGGSQILRIGLRREPPQQRELSYRLYLQQIPTE